MTLIFGLNSVSSDATKRNSKLDSIIQIVPYSISEVHRLIYKCPDLEIDKIKLNKFQIGTKFSSIIFILEYQFIFMAIRVILYCLE